MANTTSTGKFPTAYINSVNENDSTVIRVNQDRGDIGSRASGTNFSAQSARMTIEHVGKNK